MGGDGRITVLFVMGHGSSGSTILGNTLGEVDGFFHAGELRTIWSEGLAELQRCGCGEPIGQCPVWSAVLHAGFGTVDEREAARLAKLHRETMRVRHPRRGGQVAAGAGALDGAPP